MKSTLRGGLAVLAASCALLSGTAVAATPDPSPGAPVPTAVGPIDPGSATSETGPDAGAEPGDTRGTWQVEATAPDTYALTWRSPAPLPVTDAHPDFLLDGASIGTPSLAADGRTLSLTVTLPAAPDPDGLAVVLSGRVLDTTVQPPPTGVPQEYVAPGAGRRLAVDPGRPGPHRVVSEEYRLPRITLAGLPRKVEMVGHVERPADPDPRDPLVLFLHGRHSYCYRTGPGTGSAPREWPCRPGNSPVPSYLGYRYIQRLLAAQGYVTVSISANGINAQDYRVADQGARARAQLVRAHLDRWSRWADSGRYAVDMSRVVLVGHSRGGEGVDQASVETPLSAPYRIVGQVLVAPTDFSRQVAGYVPTVVLLPYCDGDVADLQGQGYTDMARDLAADDTALRSSVLVMGANHNFFNTEWTPGIAKAPSFDDAFRGRGCRPGAPGRLTAAEQRAVARTYVAGAVALTAAGHDQVLPMFDGSRVRVPSAGGADVRSHMLGGGRPVRRPGVDAVLGPSSGATARICAGRTGRAEPFCGRGADPVRAPHWPSSAPGAGVPTHPALEMSWRRAGASAGLRFSEPLDLTGATSLDVRTVVDPATGPVRLALRLYDGQGGSVTLTPERRGEMHPLPGRSPLGKLWAQPLVARLDGSAGVDLTDVTRVDVVGRSARGRVWVLDLAGGYRTLPPVPVRRLPRVVLGAVTVTVTEGDATTRQTVRLPFHVYGAVREPGRFVVTGVDLATGRPVPRRTVEVAPGQREGSVPLTYRPDRRDDLAVQRIWLTAYALHGVMPSRYVGTVRILDDDPPPRVRVRVAARTVREGRPARWVVTVSRPVDYYPTVRGLVVPGPASPPALRAADVPRRWVRAHTYPMPPPDRTLAAAEVGVAATLRPGRRTVVLRVPTVRDGRAEGTEAVTLRVWVPRVSEPVLRTVRIADGGRARVLP